MNIPARLPPGADRAAFARLQAPPPPVARFGCEAIDAAFPGGGLAAGTHQIAGQGGAALGFGLALVARALRVPGARALIVQTADCVGEEGRLHAPGLQALGVEPDRLGLAEVRGEAEALRAADEAVCSGAAAVVLADLGQGARLDLSVTRRLNLSARRTGTLALLLVRDLSAVSAALTRWRVEPRPGRGRRRRLGRPAFALSLLRNRLGPTGEWTLEWDRDDRVFRTLPPLSASVARPAVDRPDPTRRPAGGEPAGPRRQAG